jgi:hemolysin activation/secretion protein
MRHPSRRNSARATAAVRTGRRRCLLLALVLAAAGVEASDASAQDLNRTSPQPLPPQAAPPPVAPPAAVRHPADPNAVIVPDLKGLRLVGGLKSLQVHGVTGEGVASDVAFAAPVIPALQPFIGKPLTLGALAKIETILIGYYRARHRPFVNVTVPPQDVTTGVVQIVVAEYEAGTIRVLKSRWFAAGLIRNDVRLQTGDPIDSQRLEADLAWVNQNPFLSVNAVTKPGAQPGQTDLDLVVHDRFPVSVYAGYANDGSPTTGLDQWKFGAVWGNVFGTGQQLAYQFTTGDDFFTGGTLRPDGSHSPSFIAHALTATIQLPWRSTLQVIGDYEEDHPDIGPDFARTGHSEQLSLRYNLPLPAAPRLTQQLSLGYDFKSTDNNLDFGGAMVSGQSSEIDQFPISYQATLGDKAGQTVLGDTLVLSPGGLTQRNTDAAFQPGVNQTGVAFATANYAYDRLDLERDTRLPQQWTWIVKVTGQVASGNLLPSEQLNIGGMDTVRGYDEEIVGGAEGVVASTEVRTPVVAALFQGRGSLHDTLQGDVFFDYGRVFNVHAIPGAPAAEELASAGLGARYAIGDHLSLRVEGGFPFRPIPGQRGAGPFANISVTVTP